MVHTGPPASHPVDGLSRGATEPLAIDELQVVDRARIFVVGPEDSGADFPDAKLARKLRLRIDHPTAAAYPAGDLCQQARVLQEPTLDMSQDTTGGTLSFEWRGIFDPREQAATYQVQIGGYEVLIVDPEGRYRMPAGKHQVWLVREDGVGAVMEYDLPESAPIRMVREDADRCIASALGDSPEALAEHFERLQERIPDAPLYLADLRESPAKEAQIWRWHRGQVVEVTD